MRDVSVCERNGKGVLNEGELAVIWKPGETADEREKEI